MDATTAKQIVDKIIGQIFGYQNPLSLEQIMQKFAFDIRLPQQVFDSITQKPTWASSTNPAKFINFEASTKLPEGSFEKPKRPINSIQDVLAYWGETNAMAAERYINSINVAESDNIRQSENIYRSHDVGGSKNVVFSDGITNSEYVAASQRSAAISFCLRVEDSSECGNCFSVSGSSKITNSMFIQDCYNLQDCMFCSHVNSKQYWIANMPFERDEYLKIKDMVVRWILTS